MRYGGMEVIEDKYMVDTVTAWERVRSPSRAIRRARQGKRTLPTKEVPLQDFIVAGNYLIGHPARIRQLLAAMEAKNAELSKLHDERKLSILSGPAYAPREQKPLDIDMLRKMLDEIEMPPKNPFLTGTGQMLKGFKIDY
jgi:hypothetical protein